MIMASRFVLGTAQLGMVYGANNMIGKPSARKADEIIGRAIDCGINEFDTAQAYGDSEAVLGRALSKLGSGRPVRVISKVHPSLDWRDAGSLKAAVECSLKKLGVPALHGLMLHDETLLDQWDNGLGETLEGIRQSGKTMRLGASVYSPQRALQALQKSGIDFVQFPANILDRRFDRAGVFLKAAAARKSAYVRSVFLQGLLLADPDHLPERLEFAADAIRVARRFAAKAGLRMEELSIGYALQKWPDAALVLGVESAAQVEENARVVAKDFPNFPIRDVELAFEKMDERVLDPMLWPKE